MFGFTVALSHLMQGKRVRRHSWISDVWVEVVEGAIVDQDGEDMFDWCASDELLADDWELVE